MTPSGGPQLGKSAGPQRGNPAVQTWRTRADPFAEVWLQVEALLQRDAGLQAKTIWTELNERYPGRFGPGQLRTLQRRVFAWRVRSGPEREVFFPQTHQPGEQAQSDFTDMRELQVRIADQLFPHLLYHFVLSYQTGSAYRSVRARALSPLAKDFRVRCGVSEACRSSTAPTISRPPRTN